MQAYLQKMQELLNSGQPWVSVILVETAGSTPQDPGSKMLVTEEGLAFGSIGGGQVEHQAIETAQAMIAEKHLKKNTQFLKWNLNKDADMTCGGTVRLYFELFNTRPWTIAVFGAGHMANVLIPMLLNLECEILCLDTRQEWLEKLPASPQLTVIHAEDLTQQIETVPKDAFVLLMTHGHAMDNQILQKFLESRHQPYLGVIGSKSKAANMRRNLQANGMSEEKSQEFICPMGLSLGSNHPYEIAISIVAQLIESRDQKLKGTGAEEQRGIGAQGHRDIGGT